MKLTVTQTIEQGTPAGMMRFRPGVEYAVEQQGDGYLISHEPRMQRKRVDGKRVEVPVTQTAVAAAVFEKLSAFAKVEQ